MKIYPETLIDAYKIGHRNQFVENMTLSFGNMTPRKSYRQQPVDGVVFVGLQYFLKEYLIKQWNIEFFNKDKKEVVHRFKRRINNYLGENTVGTSHIEELHDLGYLPLTYLALPEGSIVPYKVAPIVYFTTHKNFAWLQAYVETIMSTTIWPISTAATTSKQIYDFLYKYAEETGGDTNFVKFCGHNFSYRGCVGHEAAIMIDAGFITSFVGSDTVPGADFMEEYYNANSDEEIISKSVNATEHAVMSSYGKDGEFYAFKRLITEVYPSGILSIVSDTHDYWKVISEYTTKLKNDILNRNGKTVFRPDCLDEESQILTKTGWKYFKDLSDTDLVAQVTNDKEIEFVKPIRIIKDKYCGDMYHIRDFYGKIDLLVTPNHRIVSYNKNGEESIQEAEKYKNNHFAFKKLRSAKYKNKEKKLSWHERFLIALQADGCIKSIKKDGSINIEFNFQKKRKHYRLINILENLTYKYKVSYPNSRNGQSYISINIEPGVFVSKKFDWINIEELDYNWSNEFLEELKHWDSHIRSDKRFKYDTTIEENIKAVEYVSIAAGRGFLLSKYTDNRKKQFSDIYTCHIMLDPYIGGQAIHKNKIQYDGYVYCVEVPSGKILVKRNRGICVTGNSGDNVKIIIGDEEAEPNTPEYKGTIEYLWDIFGGKINNKGYKELDPHVGAILGDGVNWEVLNQICEGLKKKGFCTTNMVFGIGSYYLVYGVSRDTDGWAVKSTYIEVDDVPREIFKNPKTDINNNLKKSAKGLIAVYKNKNGEFYQKDQVSWDEVFNCEYIKVFENGKLLKEHSLQDIRNRITQ